MIGGLEDITSGKIYLDNTFLNDILPRDRKLAMAFQNYALYKHMNVYDNMALGLKLRDLPRTVINTRVKTAAAFLGISDILTKKFVLFLILNASVLHSVGLLSAIQKFCL